MKNTYQHVCVMSIVNWNRGWSGKWNDNEAETYYFRVLQFWRMCLWQKFVRTHRDRDFKTFGCENISEIYLLIIFSSIIIYFEKCSIAFPVMHVHQLNSKLEEWKVGQSYTQFISVDERNRNRSCIVYALHPHFKANEDLSLAKHFLSREPFYYFLVQCA